MKEDKEKKEYEVAKRPIMINGEVKLKNAIVSLTDEEAAVHGKDVQKPGTNKMMEIPKGKK
jgi:hypothetical protein